MKINLTEINHGFRKILNNKIDIFLIDANIFIPPDRSRENSSIKAISFEFYKQNWIIPFIDTFKPIGIHESVYEEFNSSNIKNFIESEIEMAQSKIIICKDSEFNEIESAYRLTIEAAIAKNTNYKPELDNRNDRGEVKSLAYIATKDLLYFCSHDANAIRLIEDAEKLETSLDNISAIQPYELMYYFYKRTIGNTKSMKYFYKYMYRLTRSEQMYNPEWNMFIEKMDELYSSL